MKVGLTHKRETELWKMPRRIATKEGTGQLTKEDKRMHCKPNGLVKVKGIFSLEDYVVTRENHKESVDNSTRNLEKT